MPNSEKTKAAAAASAAHAEHVDRFRWFILLGLITAAMMEILDTTIINVALPRMASDLEGFSRLWVLFWALFLVLV